MCLLSCLDWEEIHQQEPKRERKWSEGCVRMVSASLSLSWHKCICLCSRALSYTHEHAPPTVNKAVQSGHNHSKPHKRQPSVSLSLPVGVNEPHWQQFILHCPNTITCSKIWKNKISLKWYKLFIIPLRLSYHSLVSFLPNSVPLLFL